MPEQVWDDNAPSGQPGFPTGKGTESATPLAWTHAQFVRLAWSVQEKKVIEQPTVVRCRTSAADLFQESSDQSARCSARARSNGRGSRPALRRTRGLATTSNEHPEQPTLEQPRQRWNSTDTYTDADQPIAHKRSYEWNHGLGETISALAHHGLLLEWLEEHDWTAWPRFPWLVQTAEGHLEHSSWPATGAAELQLAGQPARQLGKQL